MKRALFFRPTKFLGFPAATKIPIVAFLILTLAMPPAWALPTGESVVQGDASFSRSGNVLTIHQGSHHLITNWQSFSISSGGKVQFIQPSSSSVALNRVLGGSRSMINGALEANGQVILINPAGVTVGPGGSVNVNSFIASTLDVSDQEFISGGALNFVGSSVASVENHGVIHAAGGDAILIAREVINHGTINAPNGMVGLAAGSDVLVRPTGEERIYIRPGSAKGTVTQTSSGRIAAARAEVIAAGNPYAAAINLDGIIDIKGAGANAAGKVRVAATNKGNIAVAKGAHIKARQANGSGGEIALGATGGGNVEIAGVLDARGDSGLGGKIVVTGDSILLSADSQLLADGATAGGRLQVEAATQLQTNGLLSATGTSGSGGTINLLGDQIVVGSDSLVDASSAAGAGGFIHVGGGFQGQDPTLKNALTTTIASGANLKADGPAQGGSVVVWSDYGTDFAGFISATGGNGGFVEVSGKQGLSFQGLVNTGGGTLLLDPTNFLISVNNTDPVTWDGWMTPGGLTGLLLLNNVTISATIDILVAAEVYGVNSLSWSSNHTLTLSANNDISIFGNIFASNDFVGVPVDQIVITADADNNGTGDLIIGGDTFDRTQIGALPSERDIYISTNGLWGTAGNIRLSGNNIELRAGNVANAEVVVAAGQPADINGGDLFVTAKRDLLILSGMEDLGVDPLGGKTTNASAHLDSLSGKAVVTVGRNLILQQRAVESDPVPFVAPWSGATLHGARSGDGIALDLTVGGNLYASGMSILVSGKNSVDIGVINSSLSNINSGYRITVVGDLALNRAAISGYQGFNGDGIIQVGGDLISVGGAAAAENLTIWAGKNITFLQSAGDPFSLPANAVYTIGSVEMQANGNITLGYGFTVDGGDLLIRADADVGSIAGSAFAAGGTIFNALGGAPAGGADGRGGFSIERDAYTLNISTGPGVTTRLANQNPSYTISDIGDYNTATMQLMNPAAVIGGVQILAQGSGNVTISTAPIFALQQNYNSSGNFRAETDANLIVGDYTTGSTLPGYRHLQLDLDNTYTGHVMLGGGWSPGNDPNNHDTGTGAFYSMTFEGNINPFQTSGTISLFAINDMTFARTVRSTGNTLQAYANANNNSDPFSINNGTAKLQGNGLGVGVSLEGIGLIRVQGENILLDGSNGDGEYVQIGNRLNDAGTQTDIEIWLTGEDANSVQILSGSGILAYAQIGHGGAYVNKSNDVSGDITFSNDSWYFGAGGPSQLTVTLEHGEGDRAYAQIGHGGLGDEFNNAYFQGNTTGDITFESLYALNYNTLELDNPWYYYSYIQVGHGGLHATFDGDISGNISMLASGNGSKIEIFGDSNTDDVQREMFGMVGHGGRYLLVARKISGDIAVRAERVTIQSSRSPGIGAFDVSYEGFAKIGHGGSNVTMRPGLFFGTAIITGTIDVTGELTMINPTISHGYAFVQVGHGGHAVYGVEEMGGPISVNAASVTLDSTDGFTQIGHGGYGVSFQELIDSPIQVIAQNNVSLSGGVSIDSFSKIGHGGRLISLLVDVGSFGNSPITVNSLQGDISVIADGDDAIRAFAQIGHGGMEVYDLVNIKNSPIALGMKNLKVLGGDGLNFSFAQVGHGGIYIYNSNIPSTISSDITLTFGSSQNVTLLDVRGGDGMLSYAQIGHGGHNLLLGGLSGNITITRQSGTHFLTSIMGGSKEYARAQVGHGGTDFTSQLATISGDISMTGGVSLGQFVISGKGDYAYGQIGHGGVNLLDDDILTIVSGNILIQNEVRSSAWALQQQNLNLPPSLYAWPEFQVAGTNQFVPYQSTTYNAGDGAYASIGHALNMPSNSAGLYLPGTGISGDVTIYIDGTHAQGQTTAIIYATGDYPGVPARIGHDSDFWVSGDTSWTSINMSMYLTGSGDTFNSTASVIGNKTTVNLFGQYSDLFLRGGNHGSEAYIQAFGSQSDALTILVGRDIELQGGIGSGSRASLITGPAALNISAGRDIRVFGGSGDLADARIRGSTISFVVTAGQDILIRGGSAANDSFAGILNQYGAFGGTPSTMNINAGRDILVYGGTGTPTVGNNAGIVQSGFDGSQTFNYLYITAGRDIIARYGTHQNNRAEVGGDDMPEFLFWSGANSAQLDMRAGGDIILSRDVRLNDNPNFAPDLRSMTIVADNDNDGFGGFGIDANFYNASNIASPIVFLPNAAPTGVLLNTRSGNIILRSSHQFRDGTPADLNMDLAAIPNRVEITSEDGNIAISRFRDTTIYGGALMTDGNIMLAGWNDVTIQQTGQIAAGGNVTVVVDESAGTSPGSGWFRNFNQTDGVVSGNNNIAIYAASGPNTAPGYTVPNQVVLGNLASLLPYNTMNWDANTYGGSSLNHKYQTSFQAGGPYHPSSWALAALNNQYSWGQGLYGSPVIWFKSTPTLSQQPTPPGTVVSGVANEQAGFDSRRYRDQGFGIYYTEALKKEWQLTSGRRTASGNFIDSLYVIQRVSYIGVMDSRRLSDEKVSQPESDVDNP